MEIYHPKDEELLREMKRVRRVLKQKRLLWGFIITLVLTSVFGWFVFYRYCTLTVMRGPAMGQTLPDGSVVLVWRNEGEAFRQGDIILYETEEGMQIKRVMATAGDQVVVGGTHIRVNGVNIEEPYATGRNADADISYRRTVVDEDMLFVQGDQRSLSVDSRNRDYDTIREEKVVGKVRFVLWPIYKFGEIKSSEVQSTEPQSTEPQGGEV